MIQILSASTFNDKMKLTVHKTGRMGFNETAAINLRLEERPSFALGKEDDKGIEDGLYLIRYKDYTPQRFKTMSSGKSYYLATKAFFDMIDYDYVNESFIYDLIRRPDHDADVDGEVYFMSLRRGPRGTAVKTGDR